MGNNVICDEVNCMSIIMGNIIFVFMKWCITRNATWHKNRYVMSENNTLEHIVPMTRPVIVLFILIQWSIVMLKHGACSA